MSTEEKIKNSFKGLELNKSLKDRTTIRVGGRARYYKKVLSVKELVDTVIKARDLKLDHMIIGGGSNIIFSDKGYPGLVIENRSAQIEIQGESLVADSGVFSERLVRTAAEYGKSGLEFVAGIPATVGGMVINNVGAYGKEIVDVLENILILDQSNKQKMIKPKELKFQYRGSALKGSTEGKSYPVVLRAFFRVSSLSSEIISRKVEDQKKIRLKSNPTGLSAGCIFKNPKIDDLSSLPDDWQDKIKNNRISAGFLLDMAGAKELSVGHAYVSGDHANYIINKRRAKARDTKKLRDQMRDLVKEKYGIELESEVEFIGDFSDD